MQIPKLFTIVDELHQKLKNLYGTRLNKLILFGSQARGDAVPGSDIDILVVLNDVVIASEESSRTLDIRSVLSLEYDTLLSCVYISNEQLEKGQGQLLTAIGRDGVLIK